MDHHFNRRFPANPNDYKLYEEVGEGVSATVYRALCIPLNEIVAIKVLDLEKCNNDLDGIRREVQTMTLTNHPNLLRAHCSFTADHCLWVVMPYMAGGSCLHIMKSSYPEGFEEKVIATLLREVLKALVYLHGQGHIHRDVKAGNILIDDNGAVKLADFGVSACMFDTGDRQRSRNTFVGTPCWMAPEVMQQLHGYDFKADIWSFGITALELAHGHAPFSKYPPMKVLLMTLQNAPPGLDYERDKRFSKSFKDLVGACLVKDPKKRPASEKLLKHPFFKHARSEEYLVRTILDGLEPLGERFRTLKGKEANFLLQNKTAAGDKEHLSQQEYIRGISAWNFNLEDLKAQAALIPSSDSGFSLEELNNNSNNVLERVDSIPQYMSPERVDHNSAATLAEDVLEDIQDLEGPFSSAFPIRPLEALRGCFDVCEDDANATSPTWKNYKDPNSGSILPQQKPSQTEDLDASKYNGDFIERSASVPKNMHVIGRHKFSSGSLLPEHVLSPYKHIAGDGERDDLNQRGQNERNPSGPLFYRQMRDSHNSASASTQEESSEGRVVQRKGRFKVTSADAGNKATPSANCMVNSVSGASTNPSVNAAIVLPLLQFLLQQNAMQRETLINLIKCLEQTCGQQEPSDAGSSDLSQLPPASSKEKELQSYLVHLQQSVGSLGDDVQRLKYKNAQLERQISNLSIKEGKRKEKE
ncbi:serine/threonine-protein kinase fray2 isoform X1 [Asparagus officinalis]|uniref:serine/threonine-protein kinase fray2 isoform X1 n=1 Tax=Asparagus officinalis TaxID=4686 RepID=UPI00098E1329|nr:serine/threonine-protein kinase fray2 isoform X1 [Asparagus officinalis]XP_020251601.1 serine/threonine-protein kinase fray2 isoform X1 [Asparagus officinalis]XP_020251602.1 serine/threonine-protein kinase fray2 isoform X1 [Asparagus officinalis]XP_020251603.1 serine/threonine-protein kinase fray2 isoform X1 [Asparagus officinalis]